MHAGIWRLFQCDIFPGTHTDVIMLKITLRTIIIIQKNVHDHEF